MKQGIVFFLSLYIIGPCSAHIIPPYGGFTWGFSESDLPIEPGRVITDATLTLENLRSDDSCQNPILHIQLLDNPQAGIDLIADEQSTQTLYTAGYSRPFGSQTHTLSQTDNYFKDFGAYLKTISPADIGSSQNLSFSLRQIDDPNSWIYTIYERPFSMAFPDSQTLRIFSSAILELVDFAGNGKGFGFGLDSEGYLFDKITLEITIESYQQPEEKQTRIFICRNRYAPYIFAPSEISSQPGQQITFPVYVFEPDQNPYSISVKNLPTGAVFRDRLFSWTPIDQQQGTWTILLEATDGVMTSQKEVHIHVTQPTPIFTPVPNQILYEGQILILPIQAVDLTGAPLPITASGLPSNASFDGNTLRWQPKTGQAGTYKITFSAANEIRREEMTVTLIVIPGQNKPILIL